MGDASYLVKNLMAKLTAKTQRRKAKNTGWLNVTKA
jgi:hypothetical protein